MAEKTGVNGPADNRAHGGERSGQDGQGGAESTWGANAKVKKDWDDKNGAAARKAAEKANEER